MRDSWRDRDSTQSGYGEVSRVAADSGYGNDDDGGGGYGGGGGGGGGYSSGGQEPCCPLVVDPFCVLAIIGSIAFFSYILNIVITMKLGRRRRKRTPAEMTGLQLGDLFWKGMLAYIYP
jgi:hypothetical protein